MTDDEILDQWRAAVLAHAQARGDDMLDALIAKMEAEDAAIKRFGLGEHDEAYRKRFPADVRPCR